MDQYSQTKVEAITWKKVELTRKGYFGAVVIYRREEEMNQLIWKLEQSFLKNELFCDFQKRQDYGLDKQTLVITIPRNFREEFCDSVLNYLNHQLNQEAEWGVKYWGALFSGGWGNLYHTIIYT